MPSLRVLAAAMACLAATATPVLAQDRLCDPGAEDCRSILLTYIRNETSGIDVAFWFMEDSRYTAALIERHRAGVPVRVLMDTRANSSYPLNADRLRELQAAGIPMRRRLTNYILHWKMMLFHGQNVVQFSGANYSPHAWRPETSVPYENYIDEVIYFTSDTPIVNSFRTKYDDHWVDTAGWTNYANVAGLARRYPVYPKDPSLNFPPAESFRNRSVRLYDAETQRLDVIMYRITDRHHTDNILEAVARGVQVRLITEPQQYRDPDRPWHSWNVDRLYMGGVQIKHRAHAGLNHQKSVIAYGQRMVAFGSSNWTSPSNAGQVEHNIFTTKPHLFDWLVAQFERKWNNSAGVLENVDFVPLPPDPARSPAPAHLATGVNPAVKLRWHGGPWAHLYDVYLGTDPNALAPVASGLPLGPSESSRQMQELALAASLEPGTTYYWRVVSRTMALQERASPIWTFTTTVRTAAPSIPASVRSLSEAGDYDGDGTADLVTWDPATGIWRVVRSSDGGAIVRQWGAGYAPYGDVKVPGDYDGDGRTDLAVWRASTGDWFIIRSSDGRVTTRRWGAGYAPYHDVPVPGDYDGDGRTDLAVWRGSSGTWWVFRSSDGRVQTRAWGAGHAPYFDVPVPADYDGDRVTDFAVWRPSTGAWFVIRSSDGRAYSRQWGAGYGPYHDVPVPADYDGDGRTDLAVWRSATGTWHIIRSATGTAYARQWGAAQAPYHDMPAPGDYDGDGRADLAVRRGADGRWYIIRSSDGRVITR